MDDWQLASDYPARVTNLREALGGISQRELGNRAGVGKQQISNWERGKQEPPKRRLEKWCDVEGWTIGIFTEGGPMPSEVVNLPVNRKFYTAEGSGTVKPAEVCTAATVIRSPLGRLLDEIHELERMADEYHEQGELKLAQVCTEAAGVLEVTYREKRAS